MAQGNDRAAGVGGIDSRRGVGKGGNWLGPLLLTVAFVVILGLLLQLMSYREVSKQKEDLNAALTNIQLKLQNRLNANVEFLQLLAEEMVRGTIDVELFERRAGNFVQEHQELLAIYWADSESHILWGVPRSTARGFVDLQLALPEPRRALRLARELRQPYYTRPFFALQGVSAIEINVPVYDGDLYTGTFIAIYSTGELLLFGGTTEIFDQYQLCLVDGEDRLVGDCISWDEVDRRLVAEALLHPGIEDVFLRVARYRSGWGWRLKLLALLSFTMALGMGWGMWALSRGIAERRRTEADLRESEEKYRLLFSAESDAILVFDGISHEVIEANAAAQKLYGYSKEQLLEMKASDLTTAPELALKRIEDVMEGRLTHIPLDFHRRKNGTVFPAEISTGTFTWKGRSMFVGLIRDITERRKIEQIKDEMLSAVSHEMRTPLTAMLGFSEYLLENETGREEQLEYLQIIHDESSRLEGLINNLLNLQRLRAGFGVGEYREVSLQDLFAQTVTLFSKTPQGKAIAVDCPDRFPPLVADEELLRQAMENLVANALKYAPDTQVTLGVRDEGEAVVIWVADRGPGIPPEAQDQIFDRFFRIDTRDGRRVGGSGLGLPLVKEIAKVHGGEVWLESEVGRGSTFFMRIPWQRVCPLR